MHPLFQKGNKELCLGMKTASSLSRNAEKSKNLKLTPYVNIIEKMNLFYSAACCDDVDQMLTPPALWVQTSSSSEGSDEGFADIATFMYPNGEIPLLNGPTERENCQHEGLLPPPSPSIKAPRYDLGEGDEAYSIHELMKEKPNSQQQFGKESHNNFFVYRPKNREERHESDARMLSIPVASCSDNFHPSSLFYTANVDGLGKRQRGILKAENPLGGWHLRQSRLGFIHEPRPKTTSDVEREHIECTKVSRTDNWMIAESIASPFPRPFSFNCPLDVDFEPTPIREIN